MTASEALSLARSLLDRAATSAVWPRACALLTRQALEIGFRELWEVKAPGLGTCSTRAQLLCLPRYLDDEELAEEATHAWWALSNASHHHAYELAPTSEELAAWLEAAARVLDRIARRVEEFPSRSRDETPASYSS